MVKPGGTGRPMLVISARFAPLPPSRSRMVALPSRNRYTPFLLIWKSLSSLNDRSGHAADVPPPWASPTCDYRETPVKMQQRLGQLGWLCCWRWADNKTQHGDTENRIGTTG